MPEASPMDLSREWELLGAEPSFIHDAKSVNIFLTTHLKSNWVY